MDWHDRGLRFDLPVGDSGSWLTDDTALGALPRGVSEALADPIVQAVMTADRVAPAAAASLSCLTAGRFATGERSKRQVREW
jgi:hypothetical protein